MDFGILKIHQKLLGGFKYSLFSPLPGEMIQFDSYFSIGLKPPTRKVITKRDTDTTICFPHTEATFWRGPHIQGIVFGEHGCIPPENMATPRNGTA